ncbi:MAG: cytochrome-c peroxidase [Gammaproteobacteria bacterium]|nr:cytochrome-c peroxidase [Gammaproteobacteria bacterium]MYC50748.1 cytochrome-c peroxidase [Gammaproteobacteria bacterium]
MNWSRFPRPSRRQRRPIALSFFLALAVAAVLTTASTSPSPGTPQEELGRLLFWDPVLSGPMDVSCATCHHPDFAYADGRALSLGPGAVGLGPDRVDLGGGVIPVAQRNSPTLLNVAYNGLDRQRRRRRGPRFTPLPADLETVNSERAPMFWDRRARSLETQALLPLTIREEMRGDTYPEEVAVDSVVARLRAIPEYVSLFREVYGEETSIDATQVAQAIAAFERTLIAGNSPFDRFLAGDEDALTTQQRRGLDEFNEADCSDCHRGPMLSDFNMHAEGVAENPLLAEPDAGDGRFRFRTPTLRNVAVTPPYMHNGMIGTLEEVLEFYDRGRSENPNVSNRRRRRGDDDRRDEALATPGRLSGRFRGVDDMTVQQQEDIIAFLEALTDPDFDRTIPARVPSGLPPGGSISTAEVTNR